jgi:hypothetical protein
MTSTERLLAERDWLAELRGTDNPEQFASLVREIWRCPSSEILRQEAA